MSPEKIRGAERRPYMSQPCPRAALVKIRSFAQDLRRDEDQQLGLVVDVRRAPEKSAEEGNIAEERHFVGVPGLLGVENAAEHHGLAVVDQDLGDDLARIDRWHAAAGGAGNLLTDRIV